MGVESQEKQNDGAKESVSTERKLQELKEEIESWKFNFEIIKSTLDNLPEWENKAFILGAVLSWLNKLGISIESIKENKIILRLWKQNIKKNLKIATYEEAVRYETLLNAHLSKWKITNTDLNKALLYRTSSIDEYIEEVWVENTSTSSYVERLMNKYKIRIWEGHVWEIKEFKSEEEYNHLRNTLNVIVKDSQADREFLLNYFEYIKVNKKKPLDEWEVKTYKKTSDKVENGILNELEALTPEQKWSLWISSNDEAKETAAKFKNNPIDAILDTFNNWGGALWLVLGIIWAIFFGKKWALGWFIAGMWLVWWSAFAWELGKFADKKWEKWSDWSDWTSEEWDESKDKEQRWSLAKKYEKILLLPDSTSLEKDVVTKTYDKLFKNDKFINAPASILGIFETENDENKLKEELAKYWIELTDENKAYYEYIFKELKNERLYKSKIWAPKEWEKVSEYLERTNASDKKKKLDKETKLNEAEKNELISYFKIDKSKINTLIADLESLNLNLFQLLAWYKNFIETKLTWLDGWYKDKIIDSIGKKVLLINWKISDLKNDDTYAWDFENNRWIVNSEIKDIFKNINFQVLPGAFFLSNYDKDKKYTKDQKEKIKRLEEMFKSDITEEGDFDKDFFSSAWFGEIWDSSKNNWEVFDTSDEKDLKLISSIWFKAEDLLNINLLNKEDSEIESKANMWYMAWIAALIANDAASFTWVWTIPWAVIWGWYGLTDAFKEEDLMISILKTTWRIPEEYRTNKEWYDNVLAWIWAIPLAWQALRLSSKAAIVSKYMTKLTPERLLEFNAMKGQMVEQFSKYLKFWKDTEVTWENVWSIASKIPENFWLNDAEKAMVNSWWRLEKKLTIDWENITFYLKKWNNWEIDVTKVKRQDWTILEWDELKAFITKKPDVEKLNKTEVKVFNNYAKQKVLEIKPWETKTIWWVEIRITDRVSATWKYEYEYKYLLENGTTQTKRWDYNDVLKVINPEKMKDELRVTWNFEGIIKQANLNKAKDISWHRVVIENWQIVITNKAKVKLEWDAYEQFINTNLAEILKKYWVNLSDKIANPRIEKLKELSDKLAKFSEKSKNLLPEKWEKANWLLKELTKPWRTIAQLIDTLANSTSKKSDILKIFILWDRSDSYKKLSNYGRLWINAWLASSLVIFDEELNTWDLLELVTYNSLWLIAWWLIDLSKED